MVFALSSGGVGAIDNIATKPLFFVVDSIGWRSAFMVLGFACFFVSFIIWFFTPPIFKI